MRQGQTAKLVFGDEDQLVAFATGSDFVAEHERGCAPLQNSLCKYSEKFAAQKAVLAIKAGMDYEKPSLAQKMWAAFRRFPSSYPSLMEVKSLNKNLNLLQFHEGEEDGVPVAVFGFLATGGGTAQLNLDHYQLRKRKGQEASGAWCDSSFAIKVFGKSQVEALRVFAEKAKDGQAMFAGKLLPSEDTSLTGVIIALKSEVEGMAEQIAEAQEKWEGDILLEAKSRAPELEKLMREKKRSVIPPFFAIWPVWAGERKTSEVLYAVNPSNYLNEYVPYYGPYTFEQLADWLKAEEPYALAPVPRKQESQYKGRVGP